MSANSVFLYNNKLKLNYIASLLLVLCGLLSYAQVPPGYYSQAENLSGDALKNALHNIIKNHTSVSYNNLWQSFYTTDARTDNGKVWDIYSDNPTGTTHYYFSFGTDQCGTYSGEGDCYNREHTVPKSWFGGSTPPMYTDLFHLYPTDGYVNSKRSNLPFGEVSNATWTSTNGSKIGLCSYSGYTGQVFEPIDSYKGDLARTYFYMAVCYKDKNLGVETQSMFNYGELKPWAKNMLLEWNSLDPVSQKEIDRNNAVYQIQHNRNPFIDFPELAEMIFGNNTNVPFTTGISEFNDEWQVFPNPTQGKINIRQIDNINGGTISIEMTNAVGVTVFKKTVNDFNHNEIDLSTLPAGVYILKISAENNNKTLKIIKQ